jgi:hypothetical protein
MVLQVLLPGLVVFVFVMVASYAGTLRALDVYHDPHLDSIFLSDTVEESGEE